MHCIFLTLQNRQQTVRPQIDRGPLFYDLIIQVAMLDAQLVRLMTPLAFHRALKNVRRGCGGGLRCLGDGPAQPHSAAGRLCPEGALPSWRLPICPPPAAAKYGGRQPDDLSRARPDNEGRMTIPATDWRRIEAKSYSQMDVRRNRFVVTPAVQSLL